MQVLRLVTKVELASSNDEVRQRLQRLEALILLALRNRANKAATRTFKEVQPHGRK